MKDISIDREGQVSINLIHTRLVDLHDSAYEAGRKEILDHLYLAIQEKDSQSDDIALGVLLWLRDRVIASR